MKRLILALAGLFVAGLPLASISAENHHHTVHPEHYETGKSNSHSQDLSSNSHGQCPKNCHEAGVFLKKIHDLRLKIENEHHRLNPTYQKKSINPVNMAQFQGKCDASCPQLKGIERQVQRFETELEELKARERGSSTALVVHSPAKLGQCPKNCHEAGVFLKKIHDLRLKIENEHHRLNPTYQKKSINPVNMAQFQGKCDASCPQLKGIERQVQRFETELEELKAREHGSSTALVVHSPAKLGQCPKNCHEAGVFLKRIHDLRLKIENEHHRLNPTYQKKSINPVNMAQFQGKCDASCPQLKGIERQVQRFETELEELKAREHGSSTALVVHSPAKLGQCPKNCHEAWYTLHEIYKVRVALEKAKHEQDPHYRMKQIKAPTIAESNERCHADCPQIIGMTKQLNQYKAELERISGNHSSPQAHNTRGQCSPNCDNEVELRQDIHQLNIQLEQIKHQKNPSYHMKNFKEIESSIKIGKQCAIGCNNIQRLESRKLQLENQIASLTHHANHLSALGSDEENEPNITRPSQGNPSFFNRIKQKVTGSGGNGRYKFKRPNPNSAQPGSYDGGMLDSEDPYNSSNNFNDESDFGNSGFRPTSGALAPYGSSNSHNHYGIGFNEENGFGNSGFGPTSGALAPYGSSNSHNHYGIGFNEENGFGNSGLGPTSGALAPYGSSNSHNHYGIGFNEENGFGNSGFGPTSGALAPYGSSNSHNHYGIGFNGKNGFGNSGFGPTSGALAPYGLSNSNNQYSGRFNEENDDFDENDGVGPNSGALAPYGSSNSNNQYSGRFNEENDDFDENDGVGPNSGALVPYGSNNSNNQYSGRFNEENDDFDENDGVGPNSGALVPYGSNNSNNQYGGRFDGTSEFGNTGFGSPLPGTSAPYGLNNSGYNPYGTNDNSSYSQGYGYNQNTGNYGANSYRSDFNTYGNAYGYAPNNYGGSSSITTTVSGGSGSFQYGSNGAMNSGEIFHSNSNKQTQSDSGANVMAAFGSVLAGLVGSQQSGQVAQQPAAPQATAPQPSTSRTSQLNSYGSDSSDAGGSSDFTPSQDDLDDLYGSSDGDDSE